MKILALLVALLLNPLLPLQAQEPKPLAMLGTWRITAQHPSGVAITATATFTQSGRFTSLSTANDKPLMETAGTWALEGNTLVWKYERSSHPSVSPGFTDTDEVLSVSDTRLVLKSKLSGRVQEWYRVR